MTYLEFKEKYLGKSWGFPTNDYYLGECLSIVKLYIKECFGINPPPSGSNSAYGYWSNFPNPLGEVFEKVEYKNGVKPQIGWICIWNTNVGSGFGHINIVDNEITDNGFIGLDQNWGGKTAHLVFHDYASVVGFLKPKSSIIEGVITDQTKIPQVLDGQGNPMEVQAIRSKLNDQERDLIAKTNDIANLKLSVASLNQKISELEEKPTNITFSNSLARILFSLACIIEGKGATT